MECWRYVRIFANETGAICFVFRKHSSVVDSLTMCRYSSHITQLPKCTIIPFIVFCFGMLEKF